MEILVRTSSLHFSIYYNIRRNRERERENERRDRKRGTPEKRWEDMETEMKGESGQDQRGTK